MTNLSISKPLASFNRYRIGSPKIRSDEQSLLELGLFGSNPYSTHDSFSSPQFALMAAESLARAISSLTKKAPSTALKEIAGISNRETAAQLVQATSNWLLSVLGTGRDIENLDQLAKRNHGFLPGLISAESKSAIFRLENSKNVGIHGGTLEGPLAFSVGPNSALYLSNVTIKNTGTPSRPLTYLIPFGVVLSLGKDIDLSAIEEIVESLWASALSSAARKPQNADAR